MHKRLQNFTFFVIVVFSCNLATAQETENVSRRTITVDGSILNYVVEGLS